MDKILSILILFTSVCFAADQSFIFYPRQDITSVIRSIASQNDLQIIIPQGLSGLVTFRSSSTNWRADLKDLLDPFNYHFFTTNSGTIVITPTKNTVYSFPLINVPPQPTALFLTKESIEGEFIYPSANCVIVSCLSERKSHYSNLLQVFDTPRRQVFLECRFQEVSKSTSRKLGLDWTSTSGTSISVAGLVKRIPTTGGSTATVSASDLTVILNALDSDIGSHTVSKPSLRAIDGEIASVSVGQQYPLPKYDFSNDTGTLKLSGFDYKDVGVNLSILPHFITLDKCVIDLKPEVSSVVDTLNFGGVGAATIPVISTRKVSTSVEVKDGDTIVISGLIDQKDNSTKSNISKFGKLPIVGGLFKNKSVSKGDTELLIFITVKFV